MPCFMNRQTRRTVVGISILLILAFAPWQTSITAPALIESTLKAPVHLPNAAWLTSLYVTNGQAVKRGDPLISASNPELDHQIELSVERRTRLLELEVRRYATVFESLSNKLVSEQRLVEAQSRLNGLLQQRNELQLRAPSSGIGAI